MKGKKAGRVCGARTLVLGVQQFREPAASKGALMGFETARVCRASPP